MPPTTSWMSITSCSVRYISNIQSRMLICIDLSHWAKVNLFNLNCWLRTCLFWTCIMLFSQFSYHLQSAKLAAHGMCGLLPAALPWAMAHGAAMPWCHTTPWGHFWLLPAHSDFAVPPSGLSPKAGNPPTPHLPHQCLLVEMLLGSKCASAMACTTRLPAHTLVIWQWEWVVRGMGQGGGGAGMGGVNPASTGMYQNPNVIASPIPWQKAWCRSEEIHWDSRDLPQSKGTGIPLP